jgi:hypothetical protein
LELSIRCEGLLRVDDVALPFDAGEGFDGFERELRSWEAKSASRCVE